MLHKTTGALQKTNNRCCDTQCHFLYSLRSRDVANIRICIRKCGTSALIWTSASASASALINANVHADANIIHVATRKKLGGAGD